MFAGGRVVGSKAIVQLDSTSLGGVFATQNIWIEISLKGREDGNTCVFVVFAAIKIFERNIFIPGGGKYLCIYSYNSILTIHTIPV